MDSNGPSTSNEGAETQQPPPQESSQTPLKSSSEDFNLRASPKVLGYLQVGASCLVLPPEVIGLIIGPLAAMKGVGIFVALYFLSTGLLVIKAANKKSKSKIFASMVMNAIGLFVAVLGIILSVWETTDLGKAEKDEAKYIFQRVKETITINICVFEFILAGTQVLLTCKHARRCPLPRELPDCACCGVAMSERCSVSCRCSQGEMDRCCFRCCYYCCHCGMDIPPNAVTPDATDPQQPNKTISTTELRRLSTASFVPGGPRGSVAGSVTDMQP